MKKTHDFTVNDLQKLAEFNPHLVKLMPNIKAIRAALKLGFKLPGVETINHK